MERQASPFGSSFAADTNGKPVAGVAFFHFTITVVCEKLFYYPSALTRDELQQSLVLLTYSGAANGQSRRRPDNDKIL
jgi:hypothetical protein